MRGQLGDVATQLNIGLLFQGQQIGEFGDLLVEPVKRLVAARKRAREEDLGEHENDQHEDQYQQ